MSCHWQDLLCLTLRLIGVPWVIREIFARYRITIVNYHNPLPKVFAQHLEYFSRTYSFVSIDQVTTALETKDFSSLPPKPMLITLDDGYEGNARLFNIIRQYKVPAMIYVIAGVVNTNRSFWFDQLPHSGIGMERLKQMPDQQRRLIIQAEYGHSDESEYEKITALSVEQMKEFIKIGGAIGSHTLFHPLLDQCDEEVGRKECIQSRKILEKMLSVPVRHFALPNGNAGQLTRTWLQEANYVTCRTTEAGWVTTNSDPLHLLNFGIADNASIHKAAIQASGLWSFFNKIWWFINDLDR